MPFIWLGVASLGALAWNALDDSIIDPLTGQSDRPVFNPSAVVAFAAGAAFGIYAKKRGWV